MTTPQMKHCNTCSRDKQLQAFSLNRSEKDGRCRKCKQCVSAYEKTRRERIALSPAPLITHKHCPSCQITKYAHDFNRHASKPDGLRATCRACQSESKADYLRRNPWIHSYSSALERAGDAAKTLSAEQTTRLKEMYRQAYELRQELGLELQLDHIVPLNGKTVSGLHTPQNLQLVTKGLNERKGNNVIEELLSV